MPHLEGKAKALVVLIPMDGRIDLKLHKHLRSARQSTEQHAFVGGCSCCPYKGAIASRHSQSSFVSTLHKIVALVPVKSKTKSSSFENNSTKNLLAIINIC